MAIIRRVAAAGMLVIVSAVSCESSRCVSDRDGIACSYRRHSVLSRVVLSQTPTGPAPPDGFSAVLLFHGWGLSPQSSFVAARSDEWGLLNKAKTIKQLLDARYTVVAPAALKSTGDCWQTNIEPFASHLDRWPSSKDASLIAAIFKGMRAGDFGPINMRELHAVGFSSGGYMTSRMAFSYPNTFRSLAIESAALYYCGGSDCAAPETRRIPSQLWEEHPPTLFLHGAEDPIVPPSTSYSYYTYLLNRNITAEYQSQAKKGHQWIDYAPRDIVRWIRSHTTPNATRDDYATDPVNQSIGVSTQTPATEMAALLLAWKDAPGWEPRCLSHDAVNGTLRVAKCDERSSRWVRWESGALSPSHNTSHCLRVAADQKCDSGVARLDTCFAPNNEAWDFVDVRGGRIALSPTARCGGKLCIGLRPEAGKLTVNIDKCTMEGPRWKVLKIGP